MTTTNENWLADVREDAWQMFGGWVNSLTGRGDPERDKSAANTWVPGVPLPVEVLRSLFHGNALARAICTALPEWGLRNGWDLTLDLDPVAAKEVERGARRRLDALGAQEKVLRAAVWGQAYGGGLILVGADDGQGSHLPLREDRVETIRFLRVVDRSQVDVVEVYGAPDRAGYGDPAVYEVRERIPGVATEPARWHASRVVAFPGVMTDAETRELCDGWDQSVLDVVLANLSKHDSMWDNVGAAVEDASQGVWKIQGLAKATANGLFKAIETRLKIADKSRSMFGSILLDADKEGFEYVHREFGGVSDLLGQSVVRVAGAAQMPATVLMGQSPAGLNATGESDLELWYARVRAHQTGVLVSRLSLLLRFVFLAQDGPTKGKLPDSWVATLSDPRSLTPMQRAEVRARQAQVDRAMIEARVMTPWEVAVNRYTAEGWSDVTQVDLDWRRALIQAMAAELAERGPEMLLPNVADFLRLGKPSDAGGDIDPPSGESAPNNRGTGAAE